MRGRATETVIAPFAWREFMRAKGAAPEKRKRLFSHRERSTLKGLFEVSLKWGGFPEVLEIGTDRECVELLQSYVDIVLLRDIGERHVVGNLAALRAFARHLLRIPAQRISVSNMHRELIKAHCLLLYEIVPSADADLPDWLDMSTVWQWLRE